MTPRPRTVPDEAILQATATIIGRLGPSRFTLADVGREVGLSPATLVQRFGTKRGLMLSLARSSAAHVDDCFAQIRAEHPSPREALIAATTFMAGFVDSPEELANHLAFLQIDLSDPEFHALALENHLANTRGYRALIEEAIDAGELAGCDPARLARTLSAVAGGSLIAWAIERRGRVQAYVRKDVEAVLEPYIVAEATRTGYRGRRAVDHGAGTEDA